MKKLPARKKYIIGGGYNVVPWGLAQNEIKDLESESWGLRCGPTHVLAPGHGRFPEHDGPEKAPRRIL